MDKEIYELEANIIGAMILSHAKFQDAQDLGLEPEEFDSVAYGKAYTTMLDLRASDMVTLRNNIKDDILFDEIRYAATYCISPAGFDGWLKQMKYKTANNKLLKLSKEIPEIVESRTTIEEKIDKVNQSLIDNKIIKNIGTPKPVADILDGVEEEIRLAGTEDQNVVSTGFGEIDEKIKGFKSGDLVIVAGRPGMGKTTWALNIASYNIFKGKTVLMFSLEMTNEQLIKKIISSDSGLTIDKMMSGGMSQAEWTTFRDHKEKLSKTNLYVYDKSPITIETLINKTKSIQAVKDIDLIVVDYLQLLMTSNKAPSNSDSRTASMTYISNLLKGLAKDVGCPLISLSQLNRGVESRTDKRPVLSDLRDSGSIEQDADMVIMLYRGDYYDSLETGNSEVIVRKNRMGELGEFELGFDGSRSKFLDPADIAFGRKKEYGQI